MIEEYAQV